MPSDASDAETDRSADSDAAGRGVADDGTTDSQTPIEESTAADSSDSSNSSDESPESVEALLDDALERVAHGATVSVPSILVQRGLTLAFTAILTNGLGASAYGLFALARRLQRFLLWLTLGFRSGLSRFLPNAESDAERDLLVTFAGMVLLGVGAAFGAGLFVAAPLVTRLADQGAQFQLLLRVFAVGLPAGVWLFAVAEMLRGLEEVGPLNLALRVGFPVAQLAVGLVAGYVFQDLALAAGGIVVSMGLVGTVGAAWLARERGLRPRIRSPDAGTNAPGAEAGNPDGDAGTDPPDAAKLRRKYLRYTIPLFLGGFATTTQRLGFYPLIAVFLTEVAGGVFAVGVMLGALVRLPLMGLNQFVPPVAASLHEGDHDEALSRLYHVTSRLVLVGVTALGIPVVVYRQSVMGLFGPTFVAYAGLLPGFIVAQYGACAAGSVGILLTMTDHQRALLVVNVAITAFLTVTAIPLTVEFGLAGLVASYVLMLTLNNGLEVAVLYHLEGLQPFTRRHAKPLVAGVPMALVALGARAILSTPAAPLVGSALALVVYAATLRSLGFTKVERRLGRTLVERYRSTFAGLVSSPFTSRP